jgi:hypothetical protein
MATVWAAVMAAYDLDADETTILRLALEAVDRYDEARRLIAAEGPVVQDRFGQLKPHPATAIENASAIRAGRLWRLLDLDPKTAPASPLALNPRQRR